MKRAPLLCLLAVLASTPSSAAEETLSFGRFGTVTLYRPSPHPSNVVLFISGDGGWNLGVVDMARELAGLDALVVGIDIRHFLKDLAAANDKCSYPAADLETLSHFIQKKLDFPTYRPPVLVGYSSGATLVYAALVQAPPNTFAGALSLGFCPDLLLNKPMCRGNGLEWDIAPKNKAFIFRPASHVEAPWIALQGTIDQVCNTSETEQYVKKVGGGEILILPKVGHGFSVPKNWMPQFKDSFSRMVKSGEQAVPVRAAAVQDLPLVELAPQGHRDDTLAVIVSGDGGWASIDREIGGALAAEGVPVVGLNSLQYFWKPRTPDGAAKDLERILRHYLSAWNKKHAVLVGYSLGADVLPFLASRLSPEIRPSVSLVALLGPSQSASFEFHLTDWLGSSDAKGQPTLPEVQKLRGIQVLCFYGESEHDSLCPKLDPSLALVFATKGGHHFGGDYQGLAKTILEHAP
jgi:type IV secretory pathway VirJ component